MGSGYHCLPSSATSTEKHTEAPEKPHPRRREIPLSSLKKTSYSPGICGCRSSGVRENVSLRTIPVTWGSSTKLSDLPHINRCEYENLHSKGFYATFSHLFKKLSARPENHGHCS